MDTKVPAANFAEKCGQKKEPEQEPTAVDGEMYDLPRVEEPWKAGMEAVFLQKITLDYPLPGDPDYRIDIMPG